MVQRIERDEEIDGENTSENTKINNILFYSSHPIAEYSEIVNCSLSLAHSLRFLCRTVKMEKKNRRKK